MSELSFAEAVARAERRFGIHARKRRADAGSARLHAAVEAQLNRVLAQQDPPIVLEAWAEVRAWCERRRLPPPSRATVYNALGRVKPPAFERSELPAEVRACLHNVGDGAIPGHRVVVEAFNQGDTRALSFASAMPWPCLYRAARSRALRPKSRALLRAVMSYRGIPRAEAA